MTRDEKHETGDGDDRPVPVRPVVHLLCGHNGAGKTTHARELERSLPAVRFTLDEWMLSLWPELTFDSDEYAERAEQCRQVIWTTAQQVLATGTDVVLDWNLWNRARRARWKSLAGTAGYSCVLHHVVTDVDVAVERATRRAVGTSVGAHRLTDAEVRHLAGIFEWPHSSEGLDVVEVRVGMSEAFSDEDVRRMRLSDQR